MKQNRSHRKVQVVQETEQQLEGLPPRSQRHSSKPKRKIAKYFQIGLLVFGTIAVGLIVFELIQASTKSNIAVTYTEPVATSSPVEVPATEVQGTPSVTNALPSKNNTESEGANPAKAATPEKSPTSSVAGTKETPQISKGSDPKQTPQPNVPSQTKQAPQMKEVSQAKQTPTPVKPAEPKAIKHRVVSGDTLFKLSRKYYGNGMGVERIARYNGLNQNNPLPVGKVIYIPVR
ncbi:LysM peptidoglycan-binding domain-containing protein [Brevibacillus sp. SYSU BS000544]|uniref:LysM peptidoglycan-binding domain-containing protein n=1 Tax=Brevibacillus sp. SYSU BS000544 TaxID=3416443 RepID=UPI003CE48D3C